MKFINCIGQWKAFERPWKTWLICLDLKKYPSRDTVPIVGPALLVAEFNSTDTKKTAGICLALISANWLITHSSIEDTYNTVRK